jgi:hypothetical protein
VNQHQRAADVISLPGRGLERIALGAVAQSQFQSLLLFASFPAAVPWAVLFGLIIRSVYSLDASGDSRIGPIPNIGTETPSLTRQPIVIAFQLRCTVSSPPMAASRPLVGPIL